jgi:hypothetical protein
MSNTEKPATSSQNAQARFIVELVRRALPWIRGDARTKAAREAIETLERALTSYDVITREGDNW